MDKDNQVIHINPSAKLYYGLALKEFDRMDLKKAIKYFKRGISLTKDEEEQIYGRIQLALLYQHDGQFSESEQLIESLIEDTNDAYPDLYYFQAINFMSSQMKGQAKESIEYYLETAKADSPYEDEAKEMLNILKNY